MKVWPVDSRQTMLKPQDIFAVAAHEYKEGIESCREPAKKAGVSPERLSYTIMIKEYSDPRLIRIRAGNTLFTIAAFPEGVGFVRGYNGDTAQNYVNNILELTDAAKNMGFRVLLSHTTEAATKAVKLAIRKNKRSDLSAKFDSAQKMLLIEMKRGQ